MARETVVAAGIEQLIVLLDHQPGEKREFGHIQFAVKGHLIKGFNIMQLYLNVNPGYRKRSVDQAVENKGIVRAWRKTQAKFHFIHHYRFRPLNRGRPLLPLEPDVISPQSVSTAG